MNHSCDEPRLIAFFLFSLLLINNFYLEWNPVRETLSADSDTFQHAVAPQLVEDERRIDFPSPFFVVGQNTTDEIGVGVAEGDHQFGQLILVQLRHRPEHTFPGNENILG